MGFDYGHSQTARGAARRPDIAAAPRSHIARIRHGVSWEAEAATLRPNPNTTHAGMLADKKFREGIAVVGRLGLSYDVSLYHTQIGEVADLAAALPNTRIVVNHVGGVLGLGSYRSKQEEVFSRWAASIIPSRLLAVRTTSCSTSHRCLSKRKDCVAGTVCFLCRRPVPCACS